MVELRGFEPLTSALRTQLDGYRRCIAMNSKIHLILCSPCQYSLFLVFSCALLFSVIYSPWAYGALTTDRENLKKVRIGHEAQNHQQNCEVDHTM